MTDTIIELIRHGEPVGGRAYRGNRIDDCLSEEGWHQMRSVLKNETGLQQVISSPLLRCHEFAEEVASKFDIPLTVEPDLREVGFGSWEGRTPDEIVRDSPAEYEAFYADPVNNRPPGAEPLQAFYDRTVKVFDRLAKEFEDQRLLVVTHAGVIRAIVAHVLEAPLASMYRMRIDYAGVSRVRVNENRLRLEKFNSVVLRDS